MKAARPSGHIGTNAGGDGGPVTFSFMAYMLMLGLGTSLHCVTMCGPLVLTYALKGSESGPWRRKVLPNVAYQGAKTVSYMLVGLLLGALGGLVDIGALRPYAYYLAGVFMIVLGLGMTGRVPWAQRLTPRPPKALMDLLAKLRRKSVSDAERGEESMATPVALGLMTGLLPCGPLQAAQIAAAASGSAVTGALGMAAFAVGTAPLMLAFGTAGSLIPRAWKDRSMVVLAVGVMVFGLVFVNRGLVATGSPVSFMTVKTAVLGAPEVPEGFNTGADGVVEVPLVIEDIKFVPDVVRIPAGVPVRLVVDRREADTCSDELYVPQFEILEKLRPNGVTTVEIPPLEEGAYTLTCGMSMMQGQLLVSGGGSAGGGGRTAAIAGLAVVLLGGGVVLVRLARRDKKAQTHR